MHVLDPFPCNEDTNFVCPQVQHLGPGYPRDAADSMTRIVENRPLAVPPNLRSFHLKPETRLTDLVSQGYVYTIGLLASPAFVEALEGFEVQAHESYAAEVVHGGRGYPYWYLHVVEEMEPRIDFARSRFVVRRGPGQGEPVRCAGVDDLHRLCREVTEQGDGRLTVERVEFAPGTRHLDLFCLRLTSLVYFVSDALAADLVRRALTGFTLEPAGAVVTFP
jgi:hypothetical protein